MHNGNFMFDLLIREKYLFVMSWKKSFKAPSGAKIKLQKCFKYFYSWGHFRGFSILVLPLPGFSFFWGGRVFFRGGGWCQQR